MYWNLLLSFQTKPHYQWCDTLYLRMDSATAYQVITPGPQAVFKKAGSAHLGMTVESPSGCKNPMVLHPSKVERHTSVEPSLGIFRIRTVE